jgi:hypothetical protein
LPSFAFVLFGARWVSPAEARIFIFPGGAEADKSLKCARFPAESRRKKRENLRAAAQERK